MKNNYCLRFTTDADEWKNLFSQVQHPHMVQSWAYGQAKQTDGWSVRRAIFECDGRVVAICQILDKRIMGIKVASRINRGPLFLEDPNEDDMKGVFSCLRKEWQYLIGGVLVLAPAFESDEKKYQWMKELGFRDRRTKGWWSAYLDLEQDEALLRKNLKATWRSRLNFSERSGLTLSISPSRQEVEWIFERHAENMLEKKFSWPSVKFLQEFYSAEPENFYVFRAHFNDEPLSGILVYRFGDTAEYYIAWSGVEGRKKNANNFLIWNAALEMKKLGCRRFDVGGYGSSDKFGHFKLGMRGIDYRLSKEWFVF